MAATTYGALRMRVYGPRVRTHRELPLTEQAFLHFARRGDVGKRYEAPLSCGRGPTHGLIRRVRPRVEVVSGASTPSYRPQA